MQMPTPAKVQPAFDPPGALTFGRGEPLYFGQSPYAALPFVPNAVEQNGFVPDVPYEQTHGGNGMFDEPTGTDMLRVFGLTNEERMVNIALTVGAIGTAWLLFRRR